MIIRLGFDMGFLEHGWIRIGRVYFFFLFFRFFGIQTQKIAFFLPKLLKKFVSVDLAALPG
jgi:hypothetical protein